MSSWPGVSSKCMSTLTGFLPKDMGRPPCKLSCCSPFACSPTPHPRAWHSAGHTEYVVEEMDAENRKPVKPGLMRHQVDNAVCGGWWALMCHFLPLKPGSRLGEPRGGRSSGSYISGSQTEQDHWKALFAPLSAESQEESSGLEPLFCASGLGWALTCCVSLGKTRPLSGPWAFHK